MEWNIVLLWLAGSSCFITLINALKSTPRQRGWIAVALLIMSVGGASYYFFEQWAGLIAGAMWAVLLLTPAVLQRRVLKLTARQEFHQASRWAWVMAALHPFDGFTEQTKLLHAIDVGDQGEVEKSVALLIPLQSKSARMARLAHLHQFRIERRWAELVFWAEAMLPTAVLKKDPSILPLYVRALGEIGSLNDMLTMFHRYAPAVQAAPYAMVRHMTRLYVFSFTGQVELVHQLVTGPLHSLPDGLKHFWIATGKSAAGRWAEARAEFEQLRSGASPGLQRAIDSRLNQEPIIARDRISPEGQTALAQAEVGYLQDQRFSPVGSRRRSWATYAIVLANVVMFAMEWKKGGTTDDYALFTLGAFEPRFVDMGQYWRLFTANFLHFGSAHIAMNMLALLVLGPFVEFALGMFWYVLIYLLSGTAAIATVWFLMRHGWVQPDSLVGASGAIMGLIGATLAIMLRGWLRERAGSASRRMRTLIFILLLQFAADHLMPQVSGSAHIAGAVWGFVLTSLIPHRTSKGKIKVVSS